MSGGAAVPFADIAREEENIRRTLHRFRFDPEFRGETGRVPITAFAELVNVSPQALYKIMAGAHMRYDTRERIAAGIKRVLERGLRWRRRSDIWHPNQQLPKKNDHSNLLVLE